MPRQSTVSSPPAAGIVGFGAFGRLAATHLRSHFAVRAFDPSPGDLPPVPGVTLGSLADAASCPIVILAVPVCHLAETVAAIAPHVRAGAIVLDVGSVKLGPARIMAAGLPEAVEIVATHPLFGPQSARDGIRGLKIAICPMRGGSFRRVAAFLRRALGLDVIVTTPEAHDREAALAQGLTHLIAKVLVQMEPLPTRITTRSFELLLQAVDMVRDDAPEIFDAIERQNPFAADVRRRFFDLAADLDRTLGTADGDPATVVRSMARRRHPAAVACERTALDPAAGAMFGDPAATKERQGLIGCTSSR